MIAEVEQSLNDVLQGVTEKMMEDGEDRNDIMSFIYALINDNALVRLILFSYKKMMFSQ